MLRIETEEYDQPESLHSLHKASVRGIVPARSQSLWSQITEAAKSQSKSAAFSDFPASLSFGTKSPRMLVDYLPERRRRPDKLNQLQYIVFASKLHLAAGWC